MYIRTRSSKLTEAADKVECVDGNESMETTLDASAKIRLSFFRLKHDEIRGLLFRLRLEIDCVLRSKVGSGVNDAQQSFGRERNEEDEQFRRL